MEPIADRVRKRREVFGDLKSYLAGIKRAVLEIDPDSRVYIFGSVSRNEGLLASDIDILIVSVIRPDVMISNLWMKGFSEPFEFHVRTKEQSEPYFRIEGIKEI